MIEVILEDLKHLEKVLSEGSLFTPSFKSVQVQEYYTALTRGLQEAQTVDLLKRILEEILQSEGRSVIPVPKELFQNPQALLEYLCSEG